MIIVYMNLFSGINQNTDFPSFGYSEVPGGKPLLGGGSLGISKLT
ncbi:hypothetical protein JOD18_004191 [Gracilibacillus alcaliphilus]|nr:hypothetical protein [Gracilibacillus alcaliphilus]